MLCGVYDSTPLAAGDHPAGSGLGAEKRALEVHGQHSVPLGFVRLQERLVPDDPSVIHQDVDLAVGRDGCLDQVGASLQGCYVVEARHGVATKRANFRDHSARRSLTSASPVPFDAQVVDDHLGALARKEQRLGTADAPSGTGENRYLTIQKSHHVGAWCRWHGKSRMPLTHGRLDPGIYLGETNKRRLSRFPTRSAMNELVVCEVCHRHVKAKDDSCPFCSHGMATRNATLGLAGAIVMSVGLSLAACGEEASGGAGNGTGSMIALYAGPPIHDASSQGGGGGNAIALYAAPAHLDGGLSKGAGGGGGIVALYAAVPFGDASI